MLLYIPLLGILLFTSLYLLKFSCLVVFIDLAILLFITWKGIFYLKYSLKQVIGTLLKDDIWVKFKERNFFLSLSSFLMSLHLIVAILNLYTVYSTNIKYFFIILTLFIVSIILGTKYSKSFTRKVFKDNWMLF